MKNSLILQISLLILISCGIFSCTKKTEFISPPEISLIKSEITKQTNGDSVKFIINYKDLDGDIGLSQGDTIKPYLFGTLYYYNIYFEYYEKDGSDWKKVKPPLSNLDTILFAYRLPRLSSNSTPKEISGEIKTGLILQNQPVYSKNIKFKIYIYDRALHKSNFVETQTLSR